MMGAAAAFRRKRGDQPGVGTTWDPTYLSDGIALSNGNLDADNRTSGFRTAFGTKGRSVGRFAFEIVHLAGTSTNRPIMGVADKTNGLELQRDYIGNSGREFSLGLWGHGQIYGNFGDGLIRPGAAATSPSDIVTVAVDMNINELEIFLNGASLYATSIPAGKVWYPAASIRLATVRLRTIGLTYPQPGFSNWM